jgi:hypothetical protein
VGLCRNCFVLRAKLDQFKRIPKHSPFVEWCEKQNIDLNLYKLADEHGRSRSCECCAAIEDLILAAGSNVKAGFHIGFDASSMNMPYFKAKGDDYAITVLAPNTWEADFQPIVPGKAIFQPIPSKISYSFMRNCLRQCNRKHSSCVSPRYNLSNTTRDHTAYLIDVTQRRLVPTPKGAKYAALSYVWASMSESIGADRSTLCTLASLSRLQHQDFFSNKNESISQLIKDAIIFTVNMKEKYLWVCFFTKSIL